MTQIKALNWKSDADGAWFADGLGLRYYIRGRQLTLTTRFGVVSLGEFDDIFMAQEVAQHDFESQMLPYIQEQPSATQQFYDALRRVLTYPPPEELELRHPKSHADSKAKMTYEEALRYHYGNVRAEAEAALKDKRRPLI